MENTRQAGARTRSHGSGTSRKTAQSHEPGARDGGTPGINATLSYQLTCSVCSFLRELPVSFLFSMSCAPFEMTVSVLPDDIDEQNHVNNTVYLRWVQEVATAHWRAVASPEAQKLAKPVALRSNGSRKSGATTTDCSCQRLGRFGARLTRKPGARCACQRKCAHSFPLKFGS
jgi:Acyl-ACP thioesterase